jgi:hypothetical protein
MASDRERLLGTYLNDHLAGSTLGVELARFLTEIEKEIEEDRETLKQIMDRVGVGQDKKKQAFGWVGEKLGRLKPNNRLFGYSPLSRVIELEGLSLGIEGKRCLWQALNVTNEPRLAEFDFEALIERAARQRSGVEEHRLAAAQTAFGG